jgi:Caspase domain
VDARAIVIGIDAYVSQPLTSARADAVAFMEALIDVGLVRGSDVTLLTSPPMPDSRPADAGSIGDALWKIYEDGASIDRFYFYFSGHGLAAFTNASRSILHTALLPSDIRDLRRDVRLLIDFDDLRERLRLAGPREQFFFVDACRDLAFKDRPADLPGLGWPASAHPSSSTNVQAVVYAVSLGGQARGAREGMGAMSRHLVDALYGKGSALDWSDELGSHVITAESVTRYVATRVKSTLANVRGWKARYELPKLELGEAPSPLRVIADPPPARLTLFFEPEDAAGDVVVQLTSRGLPLGEPSWPPRRHGEMVIVAPQLYRLRAVTRRGVASVDPVPLDMREVSAATIRVTPERPPQAPILAPLPGAASAYDLGATRSVIGAPEGAIVRAYAKAGQPGTVIEVAGIDPPYLLLTRTDLFEEQVPPGSYEVRFRLGPEIYSTRELDLITGERVIVEPRVPASPLMAEAMPEQARQSDITVSDTIGPMHASVLPTVLSIIGVKPFDLTGQLFSRFGELIARMSPADYQDRPLRVVVALEGADWPLPINEIVASLRCETVDLLGQRQAVPLAPLALGEKGWARIAHGTTAAPGHSFRVELYSPYIGRVELVTAALAGRVSVVGFTVQVDGSLDLVEQLLPFPDQPFSPDLQAMPYEQMLRELVLHQRRFDSGELFAFKWREDKRGSLLEEVVAGRWLDPILGCMVCYAREDRNAPVATGGLPLRALEELLVERYPHLPDARLLIARAHGDHGRMHEMLNRGELPLLARGCRMLAEVAQAAGRTDAQVVSWASRVNPAIPWTLLWESTEPRG